MASEKDITSRVKFFTRKKGCPEGTLCEKCTHHHHVLAVRIGCDAMMFTDTRAKSPGLAFNIASSGQYLHLWCLEADDPPPCFEQFKVAKAL